jgi:hypothetical protein
MISFFMPHNANWASWHWVYIEIRVQSRSGIQNIQIECRNYCLTRFPLELKTFLTCIHDLVLSNTNCHERYSRTEKEVEIRDIFEASFCQRSRGITPLCESVSPNKFHPLMQPYTGSVFVWFTILLNAWVPCLDAAAVGSHPEKKISA